MHFEGKAYAWWLFEYFSLKNENTPTYANFIRRILERFDEKSHETSLEQIKPKQNKKTFAWVGRIHKPNSISEKH